MGIVRLALTPWLGEAYPYFAVYLLLPLMALVGGLMPTLVLGLVFWLFINYTVITPLGFPFPVNLHDWIGSGFYILTVVAMALLGELSLRRRVHLEAAMAVSQGHVAALQESEARFRLIADAAEVAIWVNRADGSVEFVNQHYLKFFGVNAEQLYSEGWLPLIHPEDQPEYVGAYLEAVEKRTRFDARCRVNRPNGQWTWIRSTSLPRFSASDEFMGMVGVSSDITEYVEFQTQLERQVTARTEELQQANEQLQGFTYSVAHDLRQRIRGVSVNAGMILADAGAELDNDSRESLERMVISARELSHLTDDLLTHVKVSRAQVLKEEVDLTSLAMEAVAMVSKQPHWNESTQVEIAQGMKCLGDAQMLRLVLENLIDNAAKFSQDRPSPIIKIGTDARGFWVQDNGCGFDGEFSHKIFEAFERLEPTSRYSGTGIGLANVYRVIKKHGGDVWAEGALGQGATVGFRLPS